MSEFGKKIDFSGDSSEGTRAAGCGALCAILCQNAGKMLCKCTNNKLANKGSTYYSNYNTQVEYNREPTTT